MLNYSIVKQTVVYLDVLIVVGLLGFGLSQAENQLKKMIKEIDSGQYKCQSRMI